VAAVHKVPPHKLTENGSNNGYSSALGSSLLSTDCR
jgi:hypothetical protein